MAQFSMTVNLNNDAFQNDQELARIIAEVSKKVGDGFLDGSLRDINGHTVGSFSVELDEDEDAFIQEPDAVVHLCVAVSSYQKYAGAPFQKAFSDRRFVMLNETIDDVLRERKEEQRQLAKRVAAWQRRHDKHEARDAEVWWD